MLGTIPQQQHQQRQLLQCIQRQLDVEKGLHELACQELVLVQEKQEHVTQYGAKDLQEVCPLLSCLMACAWGCIDAVVTHFAVNP